MFIHNLKYSFKTLLKNKMLIFWTFAFPIILGTFFKMAFSNIENSEKLDIIDIAIVENDEFKNNEIFKETFKELSDDNNEEKLFDIQYVNEEEAKELLNNDEITGYLIIKDEPNIVVNTSGINETILKYVTEEITQTQSMIENVAQNKVEEKVKDILSIGNQTGEGWFLTAEMVEYIENGIPNIVCVQPFACLPNHVVGKGVIKTIRSKFQNANISPVDYDPGASEANQTNRLKLLMTVAIDNLEKEIKEKSENSESIENTEKELETV